jgi:cell wall assembly regulator SMI1
VAELAVAEAALANGGPIADRMIEQLRRAGRRTPGWGRGYVWRHRADDGSYELRISTTEDLSIRDVPRAGWASKWIPLVAAPRGRSMELQLTVNAGVAGMSGRTADGERWPDRWEVPREDLAAIRSKAPWMVLPTPNDLRDARIRAADTITAWLDDPTALRSRRGLMQVEPPASEEAIATFEDKEGLRLPEAYRSLLERANGVEFGRHVVLGTQDAYRLDIPGPTRIVISPPDDAGAFALAESGEVVWVDIDDETSNGRVIADDLRAWFLNDVIGKPRRPPRR